MATRESTYGQALSKALRDQGAIVYPNIAGLGSIVGRPDKTVYHRKWFGELELKVGDESFRPGQKPQLRELWRRRPGHAFVLRFDSESFARVSYVDEHLNEIAIGGCDPRGLIDWLATWVKDCIVG